MRCQIYLRGGYQRPRIILEPIDYALAVEQRDGVPIEQVQEIAAHSGHVRD